MDTPSRFEISRKTHTTHAMYMAHYHSYYELYYLRSGECHIFIQNNVYTITGGTIAFVPPNVLHKTTYVPNMNHERIYIEFTDNYMTELLALTGVEEVYGRLMNKILVLPPEERTAVEAYIQKIEEENMRGDRLSNSMKKLYFQQMLILLLRYQTDMEMMSGSGTAMADTIIQKATTYIAEHYNRSVSLAEVAAFLHLSPSHVSKKFKRLTGIGFKQYLTNTRITNAERLLLETDQSITEIALLCGFETSNYFGDVFRHVNRCSPTEFRVAKGDVK